MKKDHFQYQDAFLLDLDVKALKAKRLKEK